MLLAWIAPRANATAMTLNDMITFGYVEMSVAKLALSPLRMDTDLT
jgi:hypothetical protein